jgi:hypothetical protein
MQSVVKKENMTTQPTKFKCTQPGCSAEYNDKPHLGIHLRAAHGIAGKSHTARTAREKRQKLKDAEKATTTQPTPKRRYTKRSTTLATIPQEANGNHTGNGQVQAQTLSRRFHAEAALAVAFGQFKELCKGIAFEYDLPPRSFTARFVEFLHAEALR